MTETNLFAVPTTQQLQINYIKYNQTLVPSSYIPNEDVCKVLLKTKECETSNTIIIKTRENDTKFTFLLSTNDLITPDKLY